MLNRFKEAKQAEIEKLKEQHRAGALPEIFSGQRPSLAKALSPPGQLAIMAEYKPASPSRGVINPDVTPAEMAAVFSRGRAGAVSVLTEESYFQSSLACLGEMQATGLPLLRKDFILDPLQVRQTAATPASALLLIVRMFFYQPEVLAGLHRESARLGLETVVEVFDRQDLEMARRIGARIIQVNNRDLSSLEVDLETSRELIRQKHKDELWISASGISRGEQVREMAGLGFNACLVGTALMAGRDPLGKLKELTAAGKS
ncbi:MAG: indole-3-glycerol-phosphate synthase [Desulfohalobiaceae bacterium]|nr:indole-3-glycerol-phosphate synthase [Desulfohalobiaceae bacterium]